MPTNPSCRNCGLEMNRLTFKSGFRVWNCGGDGCKVLTVRELEVTAALAAGFNHQQVSQMLYVSDQTIKTHLSTIYKKLEVSNIVGAVVIALQNGWLDLRTLKVGGVN